MKTQKINGTVTILKRLNNSVNGNPRFLLMIDDKVITTLKTIKRVKAVK